MPTMRRTLKTRVPSRSNYGHGGGGRGEGLWRWQPEGTPVQMATTAEVVGTMGSPSMLRFFLPRAVIDQIISAAILFFFAIRLFFFLSNS